MKPRHPSGKPIRPDRIVRPTIFRIPYEGYITPRLQQKPTEAIGFVHKFERSTDEEDEFRKK